MGEGKALVISINYYDSTCQLNGCINDGINICDILINKFNMKKEDILFLHDNPDNIGSDTYPTADNIRKALRYIVMSKPKKLWISYSGHGSSIRDYMGDEVDGMDEVLCPVDYANKIGRSLQERFIFDDELSDILKRLPSDCQCFALFDCCHSGTIVDLEYMYDFNKYKYCRQTYRKYNKCNASITSVSGCKDNQTSADAYIGGNYSGAMTYAFIKAVSENSILNYIDLVKYMRKTLHESNYSQIPQLTSNEKNTNGIFYISKEIKSMFP